MRINPKATYSFEEAVNRIINSDAKTLLIIASVLEEEKYLYCLEDLKSVDWIVKAKRKEISNTTP